MAITRNERERALHENSNILASPWEEERGRPAKMESHCEDGYGIEGMKEDL